ncbi:hypothetical protein PG985_008440 [Apiospora marii]|uniref:Uncharacterized protein n=1 Tax=Apiospora marii TaxID=335849 RepID=A0ABR1SRZ7_9PEZI
MSSTIRQQWSKLSAQQQAAIKNLHAEFRERTQCSPAQPCLTDLMMEAFSWDASRKPPIPIISHPDLDLSLDNLLASSQEARSPKRVKLSESEGGEAEEGPPSHDLPNDNEAPAPASSHQGVTNPEAMAQHIVAREASNAEHYKKQNMDILVFLVRKYLYNADRVIPWSPEDDGQPRVSFSDIKPPKNSGGYLDQCIGLLNELKSAYENKKRGRS